MAVARLRTFSPQIFQELLVMAQDKNITLPPELNAIAIRYPEKTFYLG